MREPKRAASADQKVDVFWPVLGAILVVAVIFVASVAHRSMDGVGVAGAGTTPPPRPALATTPSPAGSPSTLLIVQISSHPSRPDAQLEASQLVARGFSAHVLDSDDFRPLNRGFYVVYAGPYPITPAGRAAARRVQAKLPGALVRDLEPR